METKTKEVSLATFWRVFRRFFWCFVLAFAVGVLGAFLCSKFLISPVYASSTAFMVDSETDSANILGSTYQTGMETKAANISEIVKGNVFLQKAAEECNARYGTSYTVADMRKKLTIKLETGTAAFYVKISAGTPEEAYHICQVFQEMVPQYLKYVNAEQYNRYEEAGSKKPFYISVINQANLPAMPDSPKVIRNMVLGGFGLFVLTYIVLFLVCFLDKTIYGVSELKESFSIPVVGEIPEWRQSGESEKDIRKEKRAIRRGLRTKKTMDNRNYADRLLSKRTSFAVTEAFKALRTNLVYTSKNGETPVFGVSSAFPGAGKSIITANSTITFAQLGKKVLIIDGDMRCPAQYNIFGVDKKHTGLSEYLVGIAENPFESCLVHTAYEGLDLIPCGKLPPNPGELLASDRMTELLELAKKQYDYVFIDLPPISETSDAGVLAGSLTGYLLVVRSAYSNIQAVGASVESLQAVNGKIVGFIANDLPSKTGSYGSYGSYGGSHGYYSKYSRYQQQAQENAKES